MVLRERKRPRYKGPINDIGQLKRFFVREAYYEYRSLLRRHSRELSCILMGPEWSGWVDGLVERPKSFEYPIFPLAV